MQKVAGAEEIKKLYVVLKEPIDRRLEEFKAIWLRFNELEIIYELIFCLLTPQSKAKICWEAVLKLKEANAFESGDKDLVMKCLSGVRFPTNKTRYIAELRKKVWSDEFKPLFELLKLDVSPTIKRDVLVKEVKGIGYKEASHFLRNIWIGRDLAILDRHILKNLKKFGVISGEVRNISKRRYLELEERMTDFSVKLGVEMKYLDFIFWYMETGKIFK
ncbi:MAG: DNA lyase [Candidatus Neomarinimicrobiota bacterium]|nr:N-glycosylase/DNA lyase [Candidatus Neomarinimicrobiota bacterium]RKY54190.1 MAG: DNA lyase [Candidatus Neomarinimicrobiota bacterium]